ncbi:PDZ domain-containing protein [Acetobacteraceae bacterium H6797]|nr:PDZ domain-containing protein [Acetobacteraceae bacterium H6797]
MLETALTTIEQRHLEKTDPAELALWALRGLAVLDPRLVAEERGGVLRLVTPERVVGQESLAKGAPNAIASLFEAGWTASPALRRAGAERMLHSAFDELFNHLDPYSRYVSAEEAAQARERRVGQSGLGLRLAAGRRDAVLIAFVDPIGPAAQAGLVEGDILLAIDGVPVDAKDLNLAASLLEGPTGSEALLSVQRGRSRRQVVLSRRPIPPESLKVDHVDGLLWMRISTFSSETGAEVANALRAAFYAGNPPPGGTVPSGVVLDLRGNRGGVLSQAASVADAFLPGGVIIRTDGRHPGARRVWRADGIDLSVGARLVVLVDGRSASSAEIVATALADARRAVVVGSATLGKGLIQVLQPLPNGADLLVSWSQVISATGWPLQGLGVIPSVCTSLGEARLTETLAALNQGRNPMAPVIARLRQARVPVPASEVAALRNACPPAEGREADRTAALALLSQPQAYEAALYR